MIEIGYSEAFCTVTFAREKKKNTLSKEMYVKMIEAFDEASKSDKVKALIIRGKGEYFCGGHDIDEFIKKTQKP